MANYDLLGIPSRRASYARFTGVNTVEATNGNGAMFWPTVAYSVGDAIKAVVDPTQGSYFMVVEPGLYLTSITGVRLVTLNNQFLIVKLPRPPLAAEIGSSAFDGNNPSHVTAAIAAVAEGFCGCSNAVYMNPGDRLYVGQTSDGCDSSNAAWDLFKIS